MEINRTYSGYKFNKLNKKNKFYKICNKNENHFGYKYRTGLNIDIHKFDPTNECIGLYFSDLNNIARFLVYGIWIREVILPDDALIRIHNEKEQYKTNKFYLGDRIPLNKFYKWNDYDFCELAVQQNGLALEYVGLDNLTNEIYELAVQQNGLALKYIKPENLTEIICTYAVKQNCDAFEYVNLENLIDVSINRQNYDLCKLVIQQNGLILQYAKKQTKKICELSVYQNGLALQYVKKQTKKICELAVRQNGMMLKFVKKQTKKICELAVQQNGLALEFVRKQTKTICEFAITQNCFALQFINEKFQTKKIYQLSN
jgi:hypothetical protein